MPGLLAESIDTWVGVVGAIVLFLTGGGLFKLLDWLAKRKDDAESKRQKEEERAAQEKKEERERDRKERLEDEARENAARDRLIVRLEADIKESREEIHELRNQMVRDRVKVAKVLVHVKHLEDLLRSRGIPFNPWVDGNGSDVVPHGPPEVPQ